MSTTKENTTMNTFGKVLLSVLALISTGCFVQYAEAQDTDPLNVLMITGGGPWHDYATQKDQIREGLLERLSNIEITTDYEGGDTVTMESTDFHFSRHLKKDWAAEFEPLYRNAFAAELRAVDGIHRGAGPHQHPELRCVKRNPRENAVYPRPDQAIRPIPRSYFQCDRSESRQACAGPVLVCS